MVSDRAASISTPKSAENASSNGRTATPFTYSKLHIDVSGPSDAKPVVVLHGWGSSAHLMSPVANALADQYWVHNIDMPGHGMSPVPPIPVGLVEQAALVESYIRDTFSTPVTLFGHSNGGRISLYLASRAESAALIDRMILVSPSGIRPRRGLKYYFKSSVAKTLKFPVRLLPGKLNAAVMDWLTHSLVWRLLGSSDYNALKGTMRQSFVNTVNYFVDDAVARITCPTLVFWGSKDTAVSRRQVKLLESRIPDCGLVILEGAGHYGYLDQPGTVFAATRHFLNPDDSSGTDA